ncbi:gamma-glutamyl-gamma-aminobutyrate hydrolase family protein [Alkalihalobacterium sp. APHAB7]|uniref:gamma-glutamyl-gamma-aminobutyrate hydrolase family protein n=1 Tax=Alkalihalobacterium sp. APHAB7 TaxID=3402081 RepID=UPI003AABF3E4
MLRTNRKVTNFLFTNEVYIRKDTMLDKILQTDSLRVNSYHHQGIKFIRTWTKHETKLANRRLLFFNITLKIIILNLMPIKEKTEKQMLRLLGPIWIYWKQIFHSKFQTAPHIKREVERR